MFNELKQHRLFKLIGILMLPVLLLMSACTAAWAQETAEPSTIFLPITITPPAEPTLELRPEFASIATHNVITDGIFAVWWHPDYDLTEDHNIAQEAVRVAAELTVVRQDSLSQLGLKDPPNVPAGNYVNVYIHDPEPGSTDGFDDEWGNGVGTNEFGVPFMTLPIGAHADQMNVAHEGFHIFQYSASNLGYEYDGDSAWFIEASANWYALHKFHETTEDAHVDAAIFEALPFVAMWRSWDNAAEGDPANWQREVHQYAMSNFLFYLTEFKGVPTSVLTEGYYSTEGELPQEYLYQNVPNLRELYAEWTAANVAEFSYMTRPQWERAKLELELVGDPNDVYPTVATLTQTGTNGDWFSPAADQTPRGWSYNVIEMNLTENGPFTFKFEADPTGSAGGAAFYEARLVVKSDEGYRHIEMDLVDGLSGEMTIEAFNGDQTIYMVVSAVPQAFTGVQTYPYQVQILQ